MRKIYVHVKKIYRPLLDCPPSSSLHSRPCSSPPLSSATVSSSQLFNTQIPARKTHSRHQHQRHKSKPHHCRRLPLQAIAACPQCKRPIFFLVFTISNATLRGSIIQCGRLLPVHIAAKPFFFPVFIISNTTTFEFHNLHLLVKAAARQAASKAEIVLTAMQN